MTETLIKYNTAVLAKEKGFWLDNCPFEWVTDSGLPTKSGGIENYQLVPQSRLQKWLRDKHFIFIQIDRENIGSDEWEFAYRLEWLPKEHQDEKRRWSFFKEKKSFVDNYPYNYSGAWHTYEEALEAGLLESLKLV